MATSTSLHSFHQSWNVGTSVQNSMSSQQCLTSFLQNESFSPSHLSWPEAVKVPTAYVILKSWARSLACYYIIPLSISHRYISPADWWLTVTLRHVAAGTNAGSQTYWSVPPSLSWSVPPSYDWLLWVSIVSFEQKAEMCKIPESQMFLLIFSPVKILLVFLDRGGWVGLSSPIHLWVRAQYTNP